MGEYWDKTFETMPWDELHKYWLDKFNLLLPM